jgi:hypothetical protein
MRRCTPEPNQVRVSAPGFGSTAAESAHCAGYASVILLLLALGAPAIQRADIEARYRGGEVVNQRALDCITARLNHAPVDPCQSARLAPLYLSRARLLAMIAYEQQHRDPGKPAGRREEDVNEYSVWCRRYVATDPQHNLADSLRVAHLALQHRMTRRERYFLLLDVATTLCYLGRHHEEVSALHQAKSLAPNPGSVVWRLVQAYAEAGQLRQAQAAHWASEQYPQPRVPHLPMPPGLPASSVAAAPTGAGG